MVGESRERSEAARRPGLTMGLCLFAVALAAHLAALRDADWLAGSGAAGATLAWRIALCAGIALAGLLVVRAAARMGAGGVGAAGAGVIVVASSAARGLLWDRAGAAVLAVTLAWLLLVERKLAVRSRLAWTALGALLLAALLLASAGGSADALPAVARGAARTGLGLFAPEPFLAIGGADLLPIGFLLPIVAALSCATALLLRRFALPAGLLLFLLQLVEAGGSGRLRAALARSLPHPAAAGRLAALLDSPEPLEEAAMRASDSARPSSPAVEEELGLKAAALRGRSGGGEAELAWLERWLASRPPPRAERVLPDARARRFALLLELHGPERAAARLGEEVDSLRGDPRYAAAVAAVAVDSLSRAAHDRTRVESLLPVVRRLLERAAADPGGATAAELQCLALLRAGEARRVEAVRLAELAVEKDPRSARPHIVLARIYLGVGEREAGLREIAVARRLAPGDPAARLLEGRLLCASPDFAEKGVERMLAAWRSAPGLEGARDEIADALFAATVALLGRNEADTAERLVQQALDAVGRRPGLVQALGRIAASRREFDLAAQRFEEALAAEPGRLELRTDLAQALRDSGYSRLLAGERPAAVERFARALAVAPPGFEVTGMQAVVDSFREQGEPPPESVVGAARVEFEEAARLYSAGDRTGARSALQRSIELLPLNPLAHLNLGRIELELGRDREAETCLRTAIAIGVARSIDVEDAYPFLVRALGAQDADESKVRAVVDEYLRLYPSGRFREGLARLR